VPKTGRLLACHPHGSRAFAGNHPRRQQEVRGAVIWRDGVVVQLLADLHHCDDRCDEALALMLCVVGGCCHVSRYLIVRGVVVFVVFRVRGVVVSSCSRCRCVRGVLLGCCLA
jgi:hypothetical protein